MNKIKKLALYVFLLSTSELMYSQASVEESEFKDITGDLNFENYTGKYNGPVSTANEIMAIGRELADKSIVINTERYDYGTNKYTVIHKIGSSKEEGFSAAIFFLGDNAGVDHIRNLRAIIQGYLENAYGYNEDDSRVLAKFITIYNGVHRNDMDFYNSKYKKIVLDELNDNDVGLSLSYKEWPGHTQIVIPLRDDATGGQKSLKPSELVDDEVLEELEKQESKEVAIQSKQELIEALKNQKASNEELIKDKQENIEKKEKELDNQQQSLDEQKQDAETQEEQEVIDDQQQSLDEQKDELEDNKEEVAKDQEEQEALDEAESGLRNEVVEDVNEQLAEDNKPNEEIESDQIETIPTFFADSIYNNDIKMMLAKLMIVNIINGEQIEGTEVLDNIINRTILSLNDGSLLALQKDGENAKLSLVKNDNLTFIAETESNISSYSMIVIIDKGILAISSTEDGNWYLTRYDNSLKIQVQSIAKIDQYTYIKIEGNEIIVKDTEGDFISLDLNTLRVTPRN